MRQKPHFFVRKQQKRFVQYVQNFQGKFSMKKAKKVFTNTDTGCNNIANGCKKRKIATGYSRKFCRKREEDENTKADKDRSIRRKKETMMKIVFWSNYPKSGVTSNMAAMGIMFSLMFPSRVMMLTNHCNHENLGRVLLGSCYEDALREDSGYYRKERAYPAIKRITQIPAHYGVPKTAENLSENGLYYFTQGKLFSNEVYEFRIREEINHIIKQLHEPRDYIFIDAKSQDSISTMQLLEEADMIVVNLRQDETVIKEFFKQYVSVAGKCFFIISEYRKRNGCYKLHKFVKEFCVHPERVAAIPYNPGLGHFIDDGRITEYVLQNHDCKKKTKEYYYIWHLRKAVQLLKNALDRQEHLAIRFEEENIYA